MKLRNIPLELDTFCEGEEAERILKINQFSATTTDASGAEPASSSESSDDESL